MRNYQSFNPAVIFTILLLVIFLFIPLIIYAQSSGSGGQVPGISGSGGQVPGGNVRSITIPNPIGAKTFTELIQRIVNWLLVIGAPILTLMIIIGAFQILTAAGEPEKLVKGRHTITYAIIGYALLLLSTGLITVITNVLGIK